MTRSSAIETLLVVAFVSCAAAGDGIAQGPPIHTDTPIMLGLQGRGLRTFVRVVRRGRVVDDGRESKNPDERKLTAVQIPVVVPYNVFSERFQVGVIAPFARIDARKTTSAGESSGVGDVRVFGKYLLYQRDRSNETFRVAAKAGVELPTGDASRSPPLGTGSTDYFMTVVAGWVRGRTGLYGEGIYEVNTSRGVIDLGNRAAFNLALGFRVSPAVYETYPARQLNLFVEVNGAITARSADAGAVLENSGGTSIFLSPGVQYVGGRSWLIEGSVQLPVVQEPNGSQLATSWTTLVGVRVLLY